MSGWLKNGGPPPVRTIAPGERVIDEGWAERIRQLIQPPAEKLLARSVFEIELNSVTDNPLVIGEEIFSGGNFHGEPLALQLDSLAVAMTVLAGISERR